MMIPATRKSFIGEETCLRFHLGRLVVCELACAYAEASALESIAIQATTVTSFKSASSDLCDSVAAVARRLCTLG